MWMNRIKRRNRDYGGFGNRDIGPAMPCELCGRFRPIRRCSGFFSKKDEHRMSFALGIPECVFARRTGNCAKKYDFVVAHDPTRTR